MFVCAGKFFWVVRFKYAGRWFQMSLIPKGNNPQDSWLFVCRRLPYWQIGVVPLRRFSIEYGWWYASWTLSKIVY